MHPRYKLAYFRSEGWLQSWIDTALDIIRREWEHYKPSSSEAASQPSSQVRKALIYLLIILIGL